MWIPEVWTVKGVRLGTLSASSVNGGAPGSPSGLIASDASLGYSGFGYRQALLGIFSARMRKGYGDGVSNPNPVILKLWSGAVGDPGWRKAEEEGKNELDLLNTRPQPPSNPNSASRSLARRPDKENDQRFYF